MTRVCWRCKCCDGHVAGLWKIAANCDPATFSAVSSNNLIEDSFTRSRCFRRRWCYARGRWGRSGEGLWHHFGGAAAEGWGDSPQESWETREARRARQWQEAEAGIRKCHALTKPALSKTCTPYRHMESASCAFSMDSHKRYTCGRVNTTRCAMFLEVLVTVLVAWTSRETQSMSDVLWEFVGALPTVRLQL